MSSSKGTTHQRPGETHALSCSNCRQRKIKCLKVYPCPHCVRGGLECIFPARKKDRAPRRNKNSELLNRLAKLEAIVGQVDPAAAALAATRGGGEATATNAQPSTTIQQQQHQQRVAVHSGLPNSQRVSSQVQPSSKDDPAAKYVSGEFWANLSQEVEGIKTVLEQPSETEDASDTDGEQETISPGFGNQASYSSPSSNLVSAAIFGNPQTTNMTERLVHPSPERIKKLRDIYFRNLDMLMKILHRPTIEKEFDLFIVNSEDNLPSKSTEALFFAMYFAAITSLSPERCRSQFGEDRSILLAQYRQSVELALARADFLNNTSLECLQALTLYDVSPLFSSPTWPQITKNKIRLFSVSTQSPVLRGHYSLSSIAYAKLMAYIATATDPHLRHSKQKCGAVFGRKSLSLTFALPRTAAPSP